MGDSADHMYPDHESDVPDVSKMTLLDLLRTGDVALTDSVRRLVEQVEHGNEVLATFANYMP
jgi:hypothetical protein